MKYEVKVPFLVHVYVEVEGDSEEEAIEKANDVAYSWDYYEFLKHLNFSAEFKLQYKDTKIDNTMEVD